MWDITCALADPLLRTFIETPDDDVAERELSALIELRAMPLAKAIVGRKLRAYADDRSGRSTLQDQQDVINDSMVALVERLKGARAGAEDRSIEDFAGYAAAVIHSACAHHIRRRHPERARLKDRLRYVFSAERRLALWTSGDGELVCGLAAWRGRQADQSAARALAALVERRGAQDWITMTRAELGGAVAGLVSSAGAPVEFDAFLGVTLAAAGVVEPRSDGDASNLSTAEPVLDDLLDQRQRLANAWREILQLPVRQRAALLLNLRGTGGAALLWLLPIAGVATLRQIARVLEISDGDFARIWQDMPLDDDAIATRLGCSRQQVINLRMAARKRLANRVGRPPSSASARGPVNLAPVSGSMKGSA